MAERYKPLTRRDAQASVQGLVTRFLTAMQEHGFTQPQAAGLAGVTKLSYRSWLNGGVIPTNVHVLQNIQKVLELLGSATPEEIASLATTKGRRVWLEQHFHIK